MRSSFLARIPDITLGCTRCLECNELPYGRSCAACVDVCSGTADCEGCPYFVRVDMSDAYRHDVGYRSG